MSILPTNDSERKNLPIFRMVSTYFPKALREVTRVCVANNVRYNPDRKPADINWARGKSTDQMGSLFRHMLEYAADGLVYEELPPEVQAACGPGFERVYVLAEAAWRALAELELCIEREECKVPFKPLQVGRHPDADGVEAHVAALVLTTEEKTGPLSASQREYAEKVAKRYFEGPADCSTCTPTYERVCLDLSAKGQPNQLAPRAFCTCMNCQDARLESATKV